MKIPLVLVWGVVSMVAARAEIVFQGYMTTAEGSRFVLSVEKETSGWLAVGEKFGGCTIIGFAAKPELLTVEKDGQRSVIHLVDGKTQAPSVAPDGAVTKPIVILIGASESISVGDDEGMLDALRKRFEVVAAMNPRPTVTLRPPAEASFERLRLIFDLCKKAGITRFDIKPQ
jgi:biopolymer transport protein ExbD